MIFALADKREFPGIRFKSRSYDIGSTADVHVKAGKKLILGYKVWEALNARRASYKFVFIPLEDFGDE